MPRRSLSSRAEPSTEVKAERRAKRGSSYAEAQPIFEGGALNGSASRAQSQTKFELCRGAANVTFELNAFPDLFEDSRESRASANPFFGNLQFLEILSRCPGK